jgi:hypothetical protein
MKPQQQRTTQTQKLIHNTTLYRNTPICSFAQRNPMWEANF